MSPPYLPIPLPMRPTNPHRPPLGPPRPCRPRRPTLSHLCPCLRHLRRRTCSRPAPARSPPSPRDQVTGYIHRKVECCRPELYPSMRELCDHCSIYRPGDANSLGAPVNVRRRHAMVYSTAQCLRVAAPAAVPEQLGRLC